MLGLDFIYLSCVPVSHHRVGISFRCRFVNTNKKSIAFRMKAKEQIRIWTCRKFKFCRWFLSKDWYLDI